MNVRPFYTYYVAHVLKQYYTGKAPKNPTKAYTLNRNAVDKVIKRLPGKQQEILKDIYTQNDRHSMADKVYFTAERFHEDARAIWDIISYAERRIAQERELI